MGKAEQLEVLRQGVAQWNAFRKNEQTPPDLRGADLAGLDLRRAELQDSILAEANLKGADLSGANLSNARLVEADLSGARLSEANLASANLGEGNLSRAELVRARLGEANLFRAHLDGADLLEATLRGANLQAASLVGANLTRADFSEANLYRADLSDAHMTETDFTNSNLTRSRIFGASAWGVKLNGATQTDLVISQPSELDITVDRFELAQLLYLLLHTDKILHLVSPISVQAVLLLGEWSVDHRTALNVLQDELRRRNYPCISVIFDKPAPTACQDAIFTLMRLARFTVADIGSRHVQQELQANMATLVAPILPVVCGAEKQDAIDWQAPERCHWVLPLVACKNVDELSGAVEYKIIAPAETKVRELESKRQRDQDRVGLLF
jgi:uncharacterized protein YjbI with pentapeptide repeats